MALDFSEVLTKVLQPYSGFDLSLEAIRVRDSFIFKPSESYILYI